MMKAVIAQDKQPVLVELPIPHPQAGELLVKVATTALNRADLLQVAGNYPPPQGSPDTLGLEFAGTVEALGDGVTRFAIGDRVMALVGGGGYATYALVHEDHAMPIPDNLSMIEAGALVEAYLTAYSNMVELGELQNGETVLIHAGGGYGGCALLEQERERATRMGAHRVHWATRGRGDRSQLRADYGKTPDSARKHPPQSHARTQGRANRSLFGMGLATLSKW